MHSVDWKTFLRLLTYKIIRQFNKYRKVRQTKRSHFTHTTYHCVETDKDKVSYVSPRWRKAKPFDNFTLNLRFSLDQPIYFI